MKKMIILAAMAVVMFFNLSPASAGQEDQTTSESGRFTSWTEVEKIYDEYGWVGNSYNIHLFDNLELVEYVVTDSGLRPFNGHSAVNDRGDVYWLESCYGDSIFEDVYTIRWWNVFTGDWSDLFQLSGGYAWINGVQATNSWIVVETEDDFSCDEYNPCDPLTTLEVFSAVSREHVAFFEVWRMKDYVIQGNKLVVRRDVSDPDDEEALYITERYKIFSEEKEPEHYHDNDHHHDDHSSGGEGCFIGILN